MTVITKTPGVYIDEVSLLPPSIVQVSTAVPVFLGYTASGPLNEPVRISSLMEYEATFGGAYPHLYDITIVSQVETATLNSGGAFGTYFFYEALQLYFANGGGACYIISVGAHGAAISEADFSTGLDEIPKLDEPTLIVFPEATTLPVTSPTNSHYENTVVNEALTIAEKAKDKFVLIDSPRGYDLLDYDNRSEYRTRISNDNVSYGAAYFPHLQTTLSYNVSGDSTYDGFTLTSLKASGNTNYDKAIAVLKPMSKVFMPPSPLMAGIYAAVDRNKGVWKAPANVSLQGVEQPVTAITDTTQEDLNIDATGGKSINAIRKFSGKGNIVWGARTLAGNSNEWRYIPVRRLFLTVEESVGKATSQFVFESNDAKTWVKLKSMISSYLDGLWKDGALMGATPDEAFFVNIGLGTTMSAQDIIDGKLRIQVGISAVRPAEFIILEFSHFMNQ